MLKPEQEMCKASNEMRYELKTWCKYQAHRAINILKEKVKFKVTR